MRLDWQVALKNAISAVKTANGLTERDEFVVRAPQGTTQQLTLPSASASSSFGAAGIPGALVSSGSTGQRTDALTFDSLSTTLVARGNKDKLTLLFAKFDQLSLSAAFEKILPSVKKADEHGQYLAICVNIQLAALAVNYIQAVSQRTFVFIAAVLISLTERS